MEIGDIKENMEKGVDAEHHSLFAPLFYKNLRNRNYVDKRKKARNRWPLFLCSLEKPVLLILGRSAENGTRDFPRFQMKTA